GNAGIVMRPYVVEKVVSKEGKTVERTEREQLGRAVGPVNAKAIGDLMVAAVEGGTGTAARISGYRVGGKTGTAEKLVGGHYASNMVVTTFAGVFPMDEPRYVMVVMLDEPQPTAETFGFRTAGWNVAPVVSKTVSRIAPMLGVRPDKRREANLAEVLPFIRKEH
ncbi:MAG TPA: penicillin-binding transpeptidase domain-containing protein, partial [Sphingomicrobium sp.]|nr:penicillin-binding transpeptidase domain-containing protein [Sphingomicrobium sp.]